VDRIRDHAGLAAGEGLGGGAGTVDGHGEQCHGDALARAQQHVHLAGVRRRADLGGEVEQLVGAVTHGGDDDHHAVARGLCVHDAPRDPLDALGVGYG
jgi:hypothetical protein